MEYTRDYFIAKFEPVPSHRWGEGLIDNCALAQCGVTTEGNGYKHTEESLALVKIFGGEGEKEEHVVYEVNDGTGMGTLRFGNTPKERILNYLKSVSV